jgi:lysophospholipase L1-like esterase
MWRLGISNEVPQQTRVHDRANGNARRCGDVVKRVGKEMNCPVLDAFDLLGGDESVEHYGQHLRDGLHLSDSGNELVCEGLMRFLQMDHP